MQCNGVKYCRVSDINTDSTSGALLSYFYPLFDRWLLAHGFAWLSTVYLIVCAWLSTVYPGTQSSPTILMPGWTLHISSSLRLVGRWAVTWPVHLQTSALLLMLLMLLLLKHRLGVANSFCTPSHTSPINVLVHMMVERGKRGGTESRERERERKMIQQSTGAMLAPECTAVPVAGPSRHLNTTVRQGGGSKFSSASLVAFCNDVIEIPDANTWFIFRSPGVYLFTHNPHCEATNRESIKSIKVGTYMTTWPSHFKTILYSYTRWKCMLSWRAFSNQKLYVQ